MLRGLSARVRAFDRIRLDRIVAAALLVEIELQIWLGDSIHHRGYASLAVTGLAWAVAVRRRRPLAAVFVVLALMSIRMLAGLGGNLNNAAGVQVGVILLFYGLGAFASERRSVWMLAFAVVITSLNAVTKPGGGVSAVFPMELFAVLLPYALGRMMRARAAREQQARDVAEQLDAARDASARAAAYGERARIARELHDVLAHSVSVMVIQAGGARLVMGEQPERAEESLRSVERAGREALAEMRRLLGVLGEGDPRALVPQPGLARHRTAAGACALVGDLGRSARRRRAGSGVARARPVRIPDSSGGADQRDQARRAGARSGQCALAGRELELEVSDDGSRARRQRRGGGHGIPGMRERVALHSGRSQAGARPDGGFTVRARLPLTQAERC